MNPTPIPGRRTRPRRVAARDTAVGYLRVSTADQADSGTGLAAQRTAVENYAARAGLTVVSWHTDAGVSGAVAPDARPGMAAALAALRGRDAHILIAAKLDRVSRSVKDAAELIERAGREGWELHTADGSAGGDDSPLGRAMIGMASVFAELERGMIAARTREAMAELKARGVKLGQPTALSDAVIGRIIGAMAEGWSLRAIAAGLMADNIPTASGNPVWHPAQVKRAADSQRGRALAAEMFPALSIAGK